jgi:hypothetical protein
MSTGTPIALGMKEIGPGVAEVYAGELQIGMITWNPESLQVLPASTRWFATYANADETVPCADRAEALECLRLQHAAVQRLARSIRSIRPASEAPQQDPRGISWDFGYNTGLRDVERILREVVGQAPAGEGYTAITDR